MDDKKSPKTQQIFNEKQCSYCFVSFSKPNHNSTQQWNKRKYCSKECYSQSLKVRKIQNCLNCSNSFYPYLDGQKFCQRECYFQYAVGENHHRFGGQLSSSHKKSLSNARKNKEKFSGENHWNWRGGITSENMRIRNSFQYRDWRNFVFKRDDYNCQICDVRGGRLNAHHIEKFSEHDDKIFEKDNGITLCTDYHMSRVNWHEEEWKSYFNFNLETRRYINE